MKFDAVTPTSSRDDEPETEHATHARGFGHSRGTMAICACNTVIHLYTMSTRPTDLSKFRTFFDTSGVVGVRFVHVETP